MKQIKLTRPDDWHLHLRDGNYLAHTVAATSRYFGRAIIMPNLQPPVIRVKDALEYRQRILAALPQGRQFQPLMTLYLHDQMTIEDIQQAADCPHVYAIKLYPAGATTHSQAGVTDLTRLDGLLAVMEKLGLPLLIHGEVVDPQVDIFDREAVFIERELIPLIDKFPGLRIVLEHISCKQAVDFILASGPQVAATITPQHLLFNRNQMLAGGIKPHFYCLPILKRDCHQQALLAVATSGNSKFFLGSDSAPHSQGDKESACGCAGCYSAFATLELYAEVFASQQALDKLEAFASLFGPAFYGLPVNKDHITLTQKNWSVPAQYNFGPNTVIPLKAGETLTWQVETAIYS
jgi:dihydroorotase